MAVLEVDCRQITDWDSFHDVFARACGFPDFYGRNLNAWIDCMTYLDYQATTPTDRHDSTARPAAIASRIVLENPSA